MAAVLVVGVASGGTLHEATAEVVTLALRLGAALKLPVVGALVGGLTAETINQMATSGVSEVYTVSGTEVDQAVADVQVAVLTAAVAASGATVILAPHTLDTSEWIPLLGARLQAAVITDCGDVTAHDGALRATKMICGGAVGAEYDLLRPIATVTITPGAFDVAPSRDACPVQNLEIAPLNGTVSLVEETGAATERGPQLKQASIVVSGGLGVGGREHWSLVTDTASALGAAVGATRAVVDSGWVSSSHQVGYSGVKVSPDLYVAIGISGAVHHLAGITQAKDIVAINTDPTAEIFKVARFGVVGDAKAVIPAFVARLRELRNG